MGFGTWIVWKNIEKPEKPFKFDGLSWLIIILLSNIWQFGVCIAFFGEGLLSRLASQEG